jgi:hypothetical protein
MSVPTNATIPVALVISRTLSFNLVSRVKKMLAFSQNDMVCHFNPAKKSAYYHAGIDISGIGK